MFFSEKMALIMGIETHAGCETRAGRETRAYQPLDSLEPQFFTIPIWENLQQTFLTHFSKWLGCEALLIPTNKMRSLLKLLFLKVW